MLGILLGCWSFRKSFVSYRCLTASTLKPSTPLSNQNRSTSWSRKLLKCKISQNTKILQFRDLQTRAWSPSHSAIFSDCDCDSSYHNKLVVQDLIEVFTLCDCDNITNFYLAHFKQKQIAVTNRTKTYRVNESSKSRIRTNVAFYTAWEWDWDRYRERDKNQGPYVSYCACPVPCTRPGPVPVQCGKAISPMIFDVLFIPPLTRKGLFTLSNCESKSVCEHLIFWDPSRRLGT